jgi:hypothetical protein
MNECVRSIGRIILKENTEVLGKEPFPVLLYPPQIPHRLGLELNLSPCSEKMVGGIKRHYQRTINHVTFTS